MAKQQVSSNQLTKFTMWFTNSDECKYLHDRFKSLEFFDMCSFVSTILILKMFLLIYEIQIAPYKRASPPEKWNYTKLKLKWTKLFDPKSATEISICQNWLSYSFIDRRSFTRQIGLLSGKKKIKIKKWKNNITFAWILEKFIQA